jgi:hypothetical protein
MLNTHFGLASLDNSGTSIRARHDGWWLTSLLRESILPLDGGVTKPLKSSDASATLFR